MPTMKEIIERIKNKNGNNNFSQKDMLWYMVHKIDRIDERIGSKADKKMVYVLCGGLTTGLIAVATLVVMLIK